MTICTLTDDQIDQVSGAMDGYKFCWNGPAGSGTYPNYTNCNIPTWHEILDNFGNLGK